MRSGFGWSVWLLRVRVLRISFSSDGLSGCVGFDCND
jgi:hypothetical protein